MNTATTRHAINKPGGEKTSVLLVGYGDIASRLAKLLQQMPGQGPKASKDSHAGFELTGLRRTVVADQDGESGIAFVAADVTDKTSLQAIGQRQFDYIVATLTPGEFTEQGYRDVYLHGLQNILETFTVNKCLFWVSSTSVYGQQQGEWVSEQSEASPARFSGKVLLEAEQCLPASSIPYCIVRFAGIYGPGRNRLLSKVKSGQVTSSPNYSNRIHVDDCAGMLAFLLRRCESHYEQGVRENAEKTAGQENLQQVEKPGEQYALPIDSLYLGVDDSPCKLDEVYRFLASMLEIKLDIKQENTDNGAPGRGGNKRCSNQRIKAAGYSFIYPDYRSGYAAMINNLPNPDDTNNG